MPPMGEHCIGLWYGDEKISAHPKSRYLVEVQDGVHAEGNFQVVVELEEAGFNGGLRAVPHEAVVTYNNSRLHNLENFRWLRL